MTVHAAARSLGLLGLFAASMVGSAALAQDDEAAAGTAAPVRPRIGFNRWQEDWSVLADPSLRTEPLDDLKYIPLLPDDPASYASFGLDLRERFESNDAPFFGVGKNKGDSYLLQRLETHADVRPNANWQIFAQLEDARAPGRAIITPVDEDQFDLEQAFVTYTSAFAGGVAKIRLGRQEMAFDLQRFVSVRDGPNVRQAFDAAWLDWAITPNRAGAVEAVHYEVADVIRRAGGHNADYLGVELKFGW